MIPVFVVIDNHNVGASGVFATEELAKRFVKMQGEHAPRFSIQQSEYWPRLEMGEKSFSNTMKKALERLK